MKEKFGQNLPNFCFWNTTSSYKNLSIDSIESGKSENISFQYFFYVVKNVLVVKNKKNHFFKTDLIDVLTNINYIVLIRSLN